VVAVGETLIVPDVPLAVKLVPVHEVAFVEDQVSVEELPVVIDVGDAESVAVGACEVAVTVIVVDWVADPPAPVQTIEYAVVVAGETASVPEEPTAVKLVPTQLIAFVEDQVSVDDWPLMIDEGEAEMLAVGAGAAVTVTVSDCVADPPAPVHFSVYFVVAVGETVSVPEIPVAVKLVPVQDVALVEDQVSVEALPSMIDEGVAASLAVGVGAVTVIVVDWVADPPPPVHVMEYAVVVAGETVSVPEIPVAVKLVPVHEVALVEDQVSVEELPVVIEVGDAESVAVGVVLRVVMETVDVAQAPSASSATAASVYVPSETVVLSQLSV
jgi:hypothetical protein